MIRLNKKMLAKLCEFEISILEMRTVLFKARCQIFSAGK